MTARLITALAALSALAASAWYLHHHGYESGYQRGKQDITAAWNADKAARARAESAAILASIKNNERIAAGQQAINQQLKDSHAKEITQIRARAAADGASRLRLPATICGESAASANTQSASGSTATPAGTVALPEQTERNLRELMIEADTVVANCRVAQDFIRRNGMAQ